MLLRTTYRSELVLGDPTMEASGRASHARRARRRFDGIRHRRAAPYRAGPGLADALAACRRLARHGLGAALGFAAARGAAPRDVARVHRQALEALAAEGLDAYVSVKPAALGFHADLFGELATAAATAERRLHVDALGPETADATWALLASAPDPGVLGATLPARWRRSAADAERAAALGLAVRVVKGQWEDGDGSVDATAGFLAVVDRLRGSAAGVGVATHDPALLAASLRRLAGTPCEAELFNGLPFRAPAAVARERGVPVRVYVAYGDAAAPYDVGDLLRRPVAAWWLAQDLVYGKDKTWRGMPSC